ncbi:hypothetical protein E1193_25745 [Micromonospora sp. KC606]|uniref:hypothetical protein n=1 Tax=Micromonospora sp. KC606 TaxID=2530379 RepID=UPI0010450F0A|nr:hypothetical protein [Micromonospora sp. KC606]TDC73326.1 hypothetical protein E1193_25745 [Micromonospora sp. KC606]
MRISVKTGLAFAGVAVALAVGGGAAYAAGDTAPKPVVQIVTEREQDVTTGGAGQRWSREDCPGKDGGASTAPGTGESGQPAAPQQSTTPQEAL